MNDDAAARACRLQAQVLRAAVSNHISGQLLRTTLRLAEDYDWRAASLEAAAKFRGCWDLAPGETSQAGAPAGKEYLFPGILASRVPVD